MALDAPITSLGIFVRRYAKDLSRLGIRTVADALGHWPFRYEDLSAIVAIKDLKPGAAVTVRGTVKSVSGFRTPRRNLLVIEALLADATGNARLAWFGQKHLLTTLKPGDELLVSGVPEADRRGLRFTSPSWEPVREVQAHVGRIVPVYPVSGDLTPKAMRTIMLRAVREADALSDLVPEDVRRSHGLLPAAAMTRSLHFPESLAELHRAERSRDFGQLFLLALANGWLRLDIARYRAAPVPFDEAATKAFVSRLPFKLTDGQRKAAWQVLQDLSRPRPMNRLLDGDVGSGKTLVAAIAALNAARSGKQTVFLVPTGVLATQHFRTLARYLAKEDAAVALLSAGTAAIARGGIEEPARRDAVVSGLASGNIPIVIGTHALLEDDVQFRELAFAVVDEQHRFGVAQRKALAAKAGEGRLPHLLSMTATPIPRTLALTSFGDLDLSVIPERPPGRSEVRTTVVTKDRAGAVVAALRETVAAGHQAFVVCPRIAEEGDPTFAKASVGKPPSAPQTGRAGKDLPSVEETADGLRAALPELRFLVLHGQMKPAEKDGLMAAFAGREADALVSTTVIEVGVDQPNATLMVVEGAEAFGLAQLHQLRGRVGRGEAAGRCLLVPRSASREAYARLKLLEHSHDGFELAEADLATRGPGEILGTAQTGFGELALSALRNAALREAARRAADALLAADPTLEHSPALAETVRRRLADVQLS